MPGLSRSFLYIVLALSLSILSVWQDASAGVEVVDRELTQKKRVSRTEYVYKYRVTVQNDGTSLDNVTVYVSCDNPDTEMVKDIVDVGDLAANSPGTSVSTFAFKQDRRIPFDAECLKYEIGIRYAARCLRSRSSTAQIQN